MPERTWESHSVTGVSHPRSGKRCDLNGETMSSAFCFTPSNGLGSWNPLSVAKCSTYPSIPSAMAGEVDGLTFKNKRDVSYDVEVTQ